MIDLQQLVSMDIGLRFDDSDIENINSAFDGRLIDEGLSGEIFDDKEDFRDFLDMALDRPASIPRTASPLGAKHRKLIHNYFLIRSILQDDVSSASRSIRNGADVNARCYMSENRTYYPLVQAAIVGSLEIVKLLVESGADVDQQQMNGESALANAANIASSEHLRIAQHLLEHGANPNISAHHKLTPLAVADNSKMVKLLLDHGADPNIADSDGDLPIRARIDNRDVESIALLVAAGTNLDYPNSNGVSARARANTLGVPLQPASSPAGRQGEVRTAMDFEEGLQALVRAAGRDDLNAFNALIGNYGSGIGSLKLDGLDLETYLLFAAAASGGADVVEALIARGVDVDSRDGDGDAVLYVAAGNRNLEAVKSLIAHGADVNSTGRIATALLAAALVGDAEIASLLLEAGANTEARMPNGDTPCMVAAGHGHAQLLRLLIEYGADVNARDNDGDGALMYATSKGQTEAAAVLIGHGAGADATNSLGETALMQAAIQGRTDLVSLLVTNGASVDMQDNKGDTALAWATHSANGPVADVVFELLRNGANLFDLYSNGCCLGFYDASGQPVLIPKAGLHRISQHEPELVMRILGSSPLYQELFSSDTDRPITIGFP
ncbi:MAG: ankyrin repeat domain-containing protein, partial [Coriobacteriia bacterium]|nr:ankyrin repeat domain-containing protein [Coriobacteriia bacterium]